MHKIIAMILVVVMCIGLLHGCGVNDEHEYKYTTYLTSTSNSVDTTLPVTSIWATEIPEALEEYTIEFQGNTYTGKYLFSSDPYRCSFAKHQYLGDTSYFGVRANTGELASFSLLVPGFSEKEAVKQDIPDPEKNAYEIAEQTASEYIDTSKYTRSISSSVMYAEVDGETLEYTAYTVEYTKELGELSTDDTLRVYVNSKGTLEGVFWGEIGAFDHIGETDISLEKVENSIADKMLELKQVSGGTLSDDYEIEEHTVHMTPNKELAVVSFVYVWWERPDGDTRKDLLEMTTILQ